MSKIQKQKKTIISQWRNAREREGGEKEEKRREKEGEGGRGRDWEGEGGRGSVSNGQSKQAWTVKPSY